MPSLFLICVFFLFGKEMEWDWKKSEKCWCFSESFRNNSGLNVTFSPPKLGGVPGGWGGLNNLNLNLNLSLNLRRCACSDPL